MSSNGYVIPIDPAELASRFPYEDPRFDEEDEDLEDLAESGEIALVSADALAECVASDNYESVIEPLLDRIPEREADLIYLYFIQRKRQQDIATIFGVTQAAISYRLDRGIQRLKFLLSIPQVTEDDLRTDLPEIFPVKSECANCDAHVREKLAKDDGLSGANKRPFADPDPANCLICLGSKTVYIDVEILVGMWATTCQSEVAAKLGLTQGRVRHRFFKAVKTLQEAATKDERFKPYQQFFSSVAIGKKFNILREVRLPQWAGRGGDECG